MNMRPEVTYAEGSLSEFLEALASRSPSPGGGSAAALAGALAAALVAKTCAVSLGRADLAEHHALFERSLAEAGELRQALQRAIDEDVDAFDAVGSAYTLPRATEEDKAARRLSIQYALRGASGVPLRVARDCARVVELALGVAEHVSPAVASDGAVGAQLAAAALEGAAETVEANLGSIRDESFVVETRARLHDAQSEASAALTEVLRVVHRRGRV